MPGLPERLVRTRARARAHAIRVARRRAATSGIFRADSGEERVTPSTAKPRLAVLFDYAEEQWPSMDLCAQQLYDGLHAHHADQVDVARVQPPYHARAAKVPVLGRRGVALN